MNPGEQKREYVLSIVDLMALLRRYLAVIVIVGLLGGAAGYCVSTFLMTSMYEASAKMIVNTRQDQSATVTNDQLTSAQKLVDTYAIIIRSRTVLDPVIEKLELPMTYDMLQKIVSVSSVDGTQVMEITVRHSDPDIAQEIVNEILEISPEIIMDAVEAGSVKTIESAHHTDKPVAPNVSLNTVLACVIGVVAALVCIIIHALLDNTYKSELDIQNDLGLPVLGVIPAIESCQASQEAHTEKRR